MSSYPIGWPRPGYESPTERMGAVAYSKDRDALMTNFDNSIEPDAEAFLLSTPDGWGQYAAWNFCGYVWYHDESKLFVCDVWRYHSMTGQVTSNSLRSLMDAVQAEYGSD